MGNPPPPDDPLEIEELRFGSWAGPPGPGPVPPLDQGWETSGPGDGEPTRSERLVAWIRAHRRALAAATGIAVVLAFAIAVIVDPGGSPDAAPTSTTLVPSTTEPRPVSTRPPRTTTTSEPAFDEPGRGPGAGAAATDWRMVLDDVPDGYELTGVQLLDPDVFAWWPTGLVFAPTGSTWTTGPWITVMSSPRSLGIDQYISFNRPPEITTIGPWPAVVGRGPTGDEQIVLQDETTTVVVVGRGVDRAELVALLTASSFDGSTASVPADALPAGFAAVDSSDLTLWMVGWASTARSYLSLMRSDDGAYASVFARPATRGADDPSLAFFLQPLAYVSIGGGTGVAGTSMLNGADTPSFVVLWRLGDRELVAMGSAEVGLDGLLDLASRIVTPDVLGWRDDDWRQAQRDAASCCRFDPSISEPTYTVGALGTSPDEAWTLQLNVGKRQTTWAFQSDNVGLGLLGSLLGPTLDVGSAAGAAFQRNAYHAAAVAVLDRSQTGAVLRLTMTGSAPQTVEVPLQPVPDSAQLAPFIVAGAVLPWIDGGFIAQVVAPDGTVISTRTDADLR